MSIQLYSVSYIYDFSNQIFQGGRTFYTLILYLVELECERVIYENRQIYKMSNDAVFTIQPLS